MSTTLKWRLTSHGLRNVIERHGIDRSAALSWTNTQMERAEYVCNTLAEDGNICRMFNAKGTLFFADTVENAIVTTFKAEIKAPAVPAVAAAVARELRKKELAVLKAEEAALAERAPLEKESVTLRLALARTRSDARRNALAARINAIELKTREINARLTKEQRELALLAQGYASIV